MSDPLKAAQQALEFCEFLWREVCLNDYAEEKRAETELALRAALAQDQEQEQQDAANQAVANKLAKLINVAERYAASYRDDDRQHIVTDVLNAFYTGAKYGEVAERERWRRIAEAAQAVTEGADDIGDFRVSSTLMAALALALDEGPNVELTG